jgi:hypothetical protein
MTGPSEMNALAPENIASQAEASVHSRLTGGIVAMLALLLAWRVLTTGFDALMDAGAEKSARALFNGGAAEAIWRKRIARNPTDAIALLMLGLRLEQDGQRASAAEAIGEAMRLAPADGRVLLEAGGFHLRGGDARDGLTILKRVVDLHPRVGAQVWPVFTAALDSSRYDDLLIKIARENPRWWPAFFNHACGKPLNTDRLQKVFAARAEAGLLIDEERRCMMVRLQREQRWADAYHIWLNSLPIDQRRLVGNIFNGGFEQPFSNLGFDWIIPKQEGVTADAQPASGGRDKLSLRVLFVDKRFAGAPIYQYLTLSPGRYRFEGIGRADGLDTWLGLQWGLYCLPEGNKAPRQLTRSERFLGSLEWAEFLHEFSVAEDCPVQILRLELANPRRDAEAPGNVAVRLRGALWFDDLKVVALD